MIALKEQIKSEIDQIVWLMESELVGALQRRMVIQLSSDRQVLAEQFSKDLKDLLDRIGTEAEKAFIKYQKLYVAESLREADDKLEQLVQKVITYLRGLGFESSFKRAYGDNYKIIFNTTHNTTVSGLNMSFNVPDLLARRIIEEGGKRVGLLDLDNGLKSKLFEIIRQARSEGKGPDEIARRIRDEIPAGPWSSTQIRADVISKTETKYAQNMSAIANYRASGYVKSVQAFDNLIGYNDADCIARDKQLFSFDQAEIETEEEHPNGTLIWAPYIGTVSESMTEVGTSKSGSFGHTGRPGKVGGQGPTMRSLGKDEEYPKHLKGKIPPGWTDVEFDENPDSKMWVRARDSKGRLVYIYNPKYLQSLQDQKFSKTDELYDQYQEVYNENNSNYSKNPNESDCTKLIMETGVRPGSTADTLADKQAYGATTLEGRHIVVDTDGKVSLQFVAKEGISQNLPVDDPVTAKMLLDRAEKAGPTGKIFKTSSQKLLNYTHTLGDSGFNSKDIRTVVGTRTAVQEITKYPKPTNLKEYKLLVKNVSTAVSKKLGNTPSMALKYYISPWVWDEVKVIK